MKNKKLKITSDCVLEFIEGDKLPGDIDLYNLTYYVRYIGDTDYTQYDLVDEVNFEEVHTFVIDYGCKDCWLWRKGSWKSGLTHNYKRKVGVSQENVHIQESQESHEECPFDTGDYADADENEFNSYYMHRHHHHHHHHHNYDDEPNHVVKNVKIKKLSCDLFGDVKLLAIRKHPWLWQNYKPKKETVFTKCLDTANFALFKIEHNDEKQYLFSSLGIVRRDLDLQKNFIKIEYVKDSRTFITYQYAAFCSLTKNDLSEALVYLGKDETMYYKERQWYYCY